MNRKQLLLAAAIGLACAPVWATDYYVSPAGSGSKYTLEAPGPFTSTVIGKLKAGDNLYLMGGQYDLKNSLSINRSGTADNLITIQGYGDSEAIIDFRQTAIKTNGLKVGGSYLHIKNLTIRYAGYKGIWVEEGQYNILEQLNVYGCCNAGVQLRSGGYNMVINCDSHDNFDYQDKGGNADGFADKQGDACPGNIYIGCRSWNNSDDGWDSFERVTNGTPTVYIHCIAYNNGPATFDLSSHPRATGVDKDLSCFSGKDLSNFANGGNPNGFKVGGNGTKHNVELYRCLAVGHRSKGFDQNNNAGDMKVINCTAYKNSINYGFGNDKPFTLAVYNNVSLAPLSSHWKRSNTGTTTQVSNTWNSGYAASESDFEGLDIESIIMAERNADGTLPETTQFHLKATATNLIDRGQNFTDFSGDEISKYVSFSGAAPDLGCYEFEGNAAAILTIDGDASQMSPTAPRFDLTGRRVDNSYRGIVVQGGRKYLQK